MDTHPFAAIAEEHRAELLCAARRCTALDTQRRALPALLRRRLARLLRSGSATQPVLCCA